ncbi:MAG: cytochrome c biogenesis CcdA family protein [Actinomycetota bacterium]|nr:cytochrome c biogenesis CcdA family protein [Actinomycetota bacterium]
MLNIDVSSSLYIVLAVVFSSGFISGLSPCTLPTVVFVTAYVGGARGESKKKGFILSLFFILGIALMLSLLGVFAGLIGGIISNSMVLNFIIAGVLLVMGLWLLKVININFNWSFPKISPKKGSGILGALLLGIPFGIAASPCTMPVTLSVLAFSSLKGSAVYGMLLMFVFAIGRSIPLLVAGTFTGILKDLSFISKYQHIIEKVSGAILIGLAGYFIWQALL